MGVIEPRTDLTGKRCVLVTRTPAEAAAELSVDGSIEAYSDDFSLTYSSSDGARTRGMNWCLREREKTADF